MLLSLTRALFRPGRAGGRGAAAHISELLGTAWELQHATPHPPLLQALEGTVQFVFAHPLVKE